MYQVEIVFLEEMIVEDVTLNKEQSKMCPIKQILRYYVVEQKCFLSKQGKMWGIYSIKEEKDIIMTHWMMYSKKNL